MAGRRKRPTRARPRSGSARPADTASTRRNARLILGALGKRRRRDRARAARAARRRVRRPPDRHARSRACRAFRRRREAAAAAAIRDRLARLDAGFGFSSGACGADILFLEALRRSQGETTIVLPYDARPVRARQRGHRAGRGLAGALSAGASPSARDVFLASDQRIARRRDVVRIRGAAHRRAGRRARRRARHRSGASRAVGSANSAGGRGGTAPTVERWRREGPAASRSSISTQVVRDAGAAGDGGARDSRRCPPPASAASRRRRRSNRISSRCCSPTPRDSAGCDEDQIPGVRRALPRHGREVMLGASRQSAAAQEHVGRRAVFRLPQRPRRGRLRARPAGRDRAHRLDGARAAGGARACARACMPVPPTPAIDPVTRASELLRRPRQPRGAHRADHPGRPGLRQRRVCRAGAGRRRARVPLRIRRPHAAGEAATARCRCIVVRRRAAPRPRDSHQESPVEHKPRTARTTDPEETSPQNLSPTTRISYPISDHCSANECCQLGHDVPTNGTVSV